MIHPFFASKKAFIYFIAVWASVIATHLFVLIIYYYLPLGVALIDSFIFNTLFATLSLPIWYVLRYVTPTKQKNSSIFINHITILTLLILFWRYSSSQILAVLTSSDSNYLQFLEMSMPIRILIGLFFYLLTIAIYYLIIYYNDLQDKLLDAARLQELVTLSELNMLKSQINPHFLFNSLNSISSLTLISPPKAQEMIIKLSDFLRYSISHQTNQLISLDKELETIKLYLDIEQVRFCDKLQVEWNIEEPKETITIPSMLLQPIYENAIKHGVYNAINEIVIQTKGVSIDGFYIITIVNNYEEESGKKKGAGVGLKNVSERLRLIYGIENLLTTTNRNSKFEVEIKIPIT